MIELIPFFLLVFFLLPFLVACARGLDGAPMLLLVNLVIGWTGIGWLAVMAYAAFAPVAAPAVSRKR